MCGYVGPMTGLKEQAKSCGRQGGTRLRLCLLVSILLHCFVFAFSRVEPEKRDWSQSGSQRSILVRLSSGPVALGYEAHEKAASENLPAMPEHLSRQLAQPETERKDTGLSAPVLLSELETEIADLDSYGFVILSLDLSAEGNVLKVEVVSSTLSENWTDYFLAKFGEAKFIPWLEGGVPRRGKTSFRIDVD